MNRALLRYVFFSTNYEMTMRVYCFLIGLLLSTILTAQSDFLQDKNLVWAADLSQTWTLDCDNFDSEFEYGVNTLKLLRTNENESFWGHPHLSNLIVHAVLNGQMQVYSDSELKYNIDPSALSKPDTVVTFNPETYEETVTIVHTDLDASDIKAWRLKLILAYNKKTQNWETYPYAVAALINRAPADQDTIDYQPVFWFSPAQTRPDLESNDIVWAKSTKTRTPENHVSLITGQLVKVIDEYKYIGKELLVRFMYDNKAKYYDSYDNKKVLNMNERHALVFRVDTIVTFDPETYEEKIQIIRNDLDYNSLKYLRICQSWYWDERKKRLHICLDRTAALRNVYDSEGNFRYETPLYYQEAEKISKR